MKLTDSTLTMLKYLFIVNFLFFFLSSTLKANEIYYACSNKMEANRSKSNIYEIGEVFGFTYIKFDKKKSKITVHEHIGDSKPERLGTKKISFIDQNNVEVVFNRSEGKTKMIDTFQFNSLNGFNEQETDFDFKASLYFKHKSTFWDYDYNSDICIGPLKDNKMLEGKKAKKEYKRWIKSGW